MIHGPEKSNELSYFAQRKHLFFFNFMNSYCLIMDFPEDTERFTLTILMLARGISSAGFSDWGCVFPVSRTMASCNFTTMGCKISFYMLFVQVSVLPVATRALNLGHRQLQTLSGVNELQHGAFLVIGKLEPDLCF